ncbi:helix-turn-helix domain-containing protein [Yoonia sp. GPGPB17]
MKAIIRADGNMSVAAKALGVGRATLYRRMNRLGIKR